MSTGILRTRPDDPGSDSRFSDSRACASDQSANDPLALGGGETAVGLTLQPAAYNGYFHDQLVASLAAGMNANGFTVVRNFTSLCFESTCAVPDIFGVDPGGQLFALEVKTGQNPTFTGNQLAVYPHVSQGGLVYADSAMIGNFGYPALAPLPPIGGGLLYQYGPNTPPAYVPWAVLFPGK
jgi:hypothetical protein